MSNKLKVMCIFSIFIFLIVCSYAQAFSVQGIVTGRIYEELSISNNQIYQEFYDMQLGWIRIEFEEFYNAPQGSTFNSPEVQANKVKFQNVINNAKAKGLKVLGVIANSAIPEIQGFPDTDSSIQDFVYAVQWHLNNYNVDAIEIWNEPGCNVKFTNDNLHRYAKTLIEVYSQLKPLYPNVIFVGPATANAEKNVWIGNDSSYWEKSIFNCTLMINYRNNNNGKLPLDVISWHAYGTGGPPDGNFYFGRTFAQYYSEIINYKDRTGRNIIGNYPIWFTEYGWDSYLVGEENQRIYTEKMIKMIYNYAQIQVPFLYTYRDDGNSAGSEGNHRGIRTSADSGSIKKRVYWPFVSHNCLVGLFTNDGVNEWTIDQIIDEYFERGGRIKFGLAWKHPSAPWYGDKAHYWGPNNNGCIQQFNYGEYGECAILMKWEIGRAYTLKGNFYTFYMNNSGPYNLLLGWITSNEYYQDGYWWQNCENGKMRMDQSGNIIRVAY